MKRNGIGCDLRRPWRIVSFLLAMSIPAGWISAADPKGSPDGSTRGVQVTRATPFVRNSIRSLRTVSPAQAVRKPRNRAIIHPRIPPGSATDTSKSMGPFRSGSVRPPIAAAPSPLAPALGSSFQGLVNPPFERDVIPPNAIGTAGPDHLVSLTNADFGIFDKSTGALLEAMPLESFWAGLVTPPGEPADFPYDTRVLYDPPSGRFVAVGLDCTVAPNSWLMIAVSSTSDPLDNWYKWAIDADVDGGTQQTPYSADFPGVGIDAFNVYVTANMFSSTSYQYSKVWVIPKGQLLAGTGPVITWTEFVNAPGSLSTMQPAQVFDSSVAQYLIFEDWDPSDPRNRFRLATIDNLSGTPVWNPPTQVEVDAYTQAFDLSDAPQANDIRGIYTADTRLWNAVFRNGSLWTTHHVADGTGKVEAAWYRIDPSASAVSSQGRISDPGRWYYFPSIAVNKDDVAALGFSGSSPTEYAGGYYTVIRPPYGAAEPVSLLKSGEDTYFKEFGSGKNRWGDLSSTVVDPSDNVTFWTLQEYAWTHETGISRWATWWGKFAPSSSSPGGGGGGCMFVARRQGRDDEISPVSSLGLLLLPGYALLIRRLFRITRQRLSARPGHPAIP